MTRSGDAPHPFDATSPEPESDIAGRGHPTDQLDGTVRDLQWQLAEAERGRREAEARVAELEAGDPPETFGMRAGKVLRMAEHDAGRRREHAEDEARRIVTAAHEEAERIRQDAEQIRDDAVAVAVRMHAEATATRREADQCANAAASMNEHVLGLRSAVRGEVARLHAAMGAELRALDLPAATPLPAGQDQAPADDPSQDTDQVVLLPAQRAQPDQEHAALDQDAPSRS